MGGGHQLDAALGDGSRRRRLLRGAHLVDDDDLGHVVLHRLDHHAVLFGGRGHLHPPGVADGRVRDVPVAGDFVGRIDDDHALAGFVGQHSGDLPQHGGLADAGAAQQQYVLAAVGQVFDYLDGAEYRAPHPAGDAHHAAVAVADGRNAVQGALHPRPVVSAEIPHAGHHVLQVFPPDGFLIQYHVAGRKTRFRRPAQVKDDLQQVIKVVLLL